MPYLLDTDSASLAFEGNERVRSRIRQASGVWLSSIAAEERVRGALNLIQKSRDKPSLPAAQDFLTRLLVDISSYDIHPYNEQAARIFASFSAQVKRVGSQDCRIAASVIAAGWIVVTANQKDFSRILGVQFEDWSR
jgi:tRNA(fMet)-specific endonuclease VapC